MDAERSSQPNLHGLMVSVGARHTGELGFDSLLRNFFKNLTQHLALPESPAGQTVRHHLFKGTVSRDFFALVFSLNLFILVLLEMP